MNIDEKNSLSLQNLTRDIENSEKKSNKLSILIKHVAIPIVLGLGGFSLGCALIAHEYRVTGVATVTCSVIMSVVATVLNYPKDYSNPALRSEIRKILREADLELFVRAVGKKFELEDLSKEGFLTSTMQMHITLTYQDYNALVRELNAFRLCVSRDKEAIQAEIENLKNAWKYYQDSELRTFIANKTTL